MNKDQSLQAKAIDLGNGKESIIVNGEVFAKSVKAGTWNYIIKVSFSKQSGEQFFDIGKSKTLEAAQTWTARSMFDEYLSAPRAREAELRGEELEIVHSKSLRSTVWRSHFQNIKREIVEIER